ncbi:uncharacterized protein L3040_005201 [Drepanopeziza brunnea f. sp. 'multigermtubi']|uniref:uncharacterized protein n=1 Tax=Drepanopeziza brunnea f. sp. 'multigermtubi' TaxID=698441 RepID=UPI0023A1E632|nr:hypothetical protein L3040_005201 [Drepanopeziza brunnea f. sp. 'multigermtubi']
MRPADISSFFSKSNVRKLEPIIHSNISKLMGRMYELEFTSQPINLNVVYSAFTSDIIMEYGFGESQHYLEKDGFNADFFGMMDLMHHLRAAAKQFGWLLPVMLSIPEFITTRIDKGMAANNKGLGRYLVTFSKGSRQCVGINPAYNELFLRLNAVFGRYGGVAGVDSTAAATLSLFKTTRADMESDRDLFVPGPKKGSKGVRVVFSR